MLGPQATLRMAVITVAIVNTQKDIFFFFFLRIFSLRRILGEGDTLRLAVSPEAILSQKEGELSLSLL